MTDEAQPKQPGAAWKEHRDAIEERNAAVRKQAQADKKVRNGALEDKAREETRREREHLEALNARIDKQRSQR